jgi:hypothetical protein
MLKYITKFILLLSLVTSATFASASLINANAILNYDQEVNPANLTPSSASGIASLVFDTDALTVDIEATITGISLADITFPPGAGLAFGNAGPFHIHTGFFGENGPVVVPFNLASYFTETSTGLSIMALNIAFSADLIDDLQNGGLYLNLHTLNYGGGEIRGQISAVNAPSMFAFLMFVAAAACVRYPTKRS